MTIPTVALNEATPAGSDFIRDGDNRITENKTQNREILEVDHEYPSSGQSATAGQHKQVTLQEAADIGTGAEGVPILGAQTIDGKAELVFTDEDDNDIQLTDAGSPLTDTLKEAIFNYLYPVGKVVTFGISTNPNTIFGYGTWAAIEGKVIVGIDSGTFDLLDEALGAETVDASHDHGGWSGGVNFSGGGVDTAGALDTKHRHTIASDGSATQSTLQPSITKYIWQRTV